MGLNDKRFIGDVDDDFRCPICRDIVEDPIASQCEHVFCKICINQWLERKTSCPVDRKPLNISQLCEPARYFRNFYLKLVMKCVFELNGCKESFKIEDLHNHQNKCKFNPNVKSGCEKGCEALLNGNELISHNCVQYLKSVNLKHEQDMKKMTKQMTEQSDLIKKLTDRVEYERSETVKLEKLIKRQIEEIEIAKKKESEKHEFVKNFESMLSTNSRAIESMLLSQSKAINEFKQELENQPSTSTHKNRIVKTEDDSTLLESELIYMRQDEISDDIYETRKYFTPFKNRRNRNENKTK